jgi:large subunit ribosomal protein L4
MATVDILSPTGKKAGSVDLPDDVFDVQTNIPLIHQVVVGQLAAARQGTASTKTRGEVRGGGRKPHKQKGTGRARQGSTRAPQFVGGGVVHGPKPRDYSQRTPKKMKAAALRGALSDRARHDRIHVFSALVEGDKPSTKAAWTILNGLSERKNLLVVVERTDTTSWSSLRNLENVHVLVPDQLNTYDVLCADDIVFTQGALSTFLAGPTKGKAGQDDVEAVDEQASDRPDVEPADVQDKVEGPSGPDSADPLDDGSAPEGFTIKGNKDSMKYHTTDSQWYDQTVAEVWFRTAEAAEAAGFVAPGSTAKAADDEEDTK